jgi:DNA-binding PadR family transcriptional regulator
MNAVDLPELPATSWAVLGLLSFDRELSGYEVKKWADSSLRFFYWSPASSQIYSELRRLEHLGLLTSRVAAQDDLRNKRLYRITTAGSTALRSWVENAPVEPPVLKHGVVLRAWLGHLSTPAHVRAVVEQHREYAVTMASEAQKAAGSAHDVPEWAYPELVTRWSQRYYEAERDVADALLRDLDALTARNARSRRSRTRAGPNPRSRS